MQNGLYSWEKNNNPDKSECLIHSKQWGIKSPRPQLHPHPPAAASLLGAGASVVVDEEGSV